MESKSALKFKTVYIIKMGLGDGESSSSGELLGAQAHLWNHIFNFINSFSLKCAIELGIPDIIHNHGQPMSLSLLASALPVNPAKAHNLYRLMRILVHSGFFVQQGACGGDDKHEVEYLPTPSSHLLLRDNPLSVSPFLLAMLHPILTTPWQSVSTWFQNEDPNPFYSVNGTSFWDIASHDPAVNKLFNEAMASDARLLTSVVIKECKGVFQELNSLVDVGGGTGTVAKVIADAFPHLNCTVLDLPHVVADLKGKNNLNFVGGDMFEEIPQADAVLLKWILHDWSDEESVKILKRCKEAISGKEQGGKVVIIDMVVGNKKEDDESTETQLFFDMLMMVLTTGRERTEKEWKKLFMDAGFSGYKITPVLGLRSVIEIYL